MLLVEARPLSEALLPPETSSSESEMSVGRRVALGLERVVLLGVYLIFALLIPVAIILVVLWWPIRRVNRYCVEEWERWRGIPPKSTDSWAHPGERPPKLDMRVDVEYHSVYVTATDGTRLAVDVWLPARALAAGPQGSTVPCILHQARYYRSTRLQWPLSWLINGGKPINFISGNFHKAFLSRGMAVVSFDVRGSGASFGRHLGPWHAKERTDAVAVMEFALRQPWCNGRIGLWGISYEGTAAFMSSLDVHPAVQACCPMYMFWDVYGDVSFPGGVPMRYFLENWQVFTDRLDAGNVRRGGILAYLFLEGVSPVPGGDGEGAKDKDGSSARHAAIKEHATNWSCQSDSHLRFLDDVGTVSGAHVQDACAWHSVRKLLTERPREELQRQLPHYLHVSGWLDATAAASLLAYAYVPCRSRHLLVGPWNHGGTQQVRTHDSEHHSSASSFDFCTEVGDFFLARLHSPASEAPGSNNNSAATEGETAFSVAMTQPTVLSSTELRAVVSQHGAENNNNSQWTAVTPTINPEGEVPLANGGSGSHGGGGGGGSGSRGGGGGSTASATVVAATVASGSAGSVRYYCFQEERWRSGVAKDPHHPVADPDDPLEPAAGQRDFPWHPTQRRDQTFFLGAVPEVSVEGSGSAELSPERALCADTSHSGKRGKAAVGSDGGLINSAAPPKGSVATQELSVDIWSDQDAHGKSRWNAMTKLFEPIRYDMEGPLVNHLRYTSAPLSSPLEVTGFPVVTLCVSADRPNLDLFVYLQAVDARGRSIYVTEGCFRAQHRRLDAPTGVGCGLASATPTDDNGNDSVATSRYDVRALPGVPLHSFRKADAIDLEAGQPTELNFSLMPTSFTFLAGQRVRLSVSGADVRHFRPLEGDANHHVYYNLRVHSGEGQPSRIVLPSPIPSVPHP